MLLSRFLSRTLSFLVSLAMILGPGTSLRARPWELLLTKNSSAQASTSTELNPRKSPLPPSQFDAVLRAGLVAVGVAGLGALGWLAFTSLLGSSSILASVTLWGSSILAAPLFVTSYFRSLGTPVDEESRLGLVLVSAITLQTLPSLLPVMGPLGGLVSALVAGVLGTQIVSVGSADKPPGPESTAPKKVNPKRANSERVYSPKGDPERVALASGARSSGNRLKVEPPPAREESESREGLVRTGRAQESLAELHAALRDQDRARTQRAFEIYRREMQARGNQTLRAAVALGEGNF